MLQSKAALEREEKTRQAVKFAMEGRWRDAVLVNEELAELYPDDPGVWNRLGKALLELGRYMEARDAFSRTLESQPKNPIATRNLNRLGKLEKSQTTPKTATQHVPRHFIDESGVTSLTTLRDVSTSGILLRLSPGDTVRIAVEGKKLVIRSNQDEYVGQVEARLAARTIRLQAGGNRYEAAIVSADESGAGVVIREVYQDPSQSGVVSFPRRGGDYVGFDSMGPLPYDSDEGTVLDEAKLPPLPAWTEDESGNFTDEDTDESEERLTIRINAEESDEVEEEFDS